MTLIEKRGNYMIIMISEKKLIKFNAHSIFESRGRKDFLNPVNIFK